MYRSLCIFNFSFFIFNCRGIFGLGRRFFGYFRLLDEIVGFQVVGFVLLGLGRRLGELHQIGALSGSSSCRMVSMISSEVISMAPKPQRAAM